MNIASPRGVRTAVAGLRSALLGAGLGTAVLLAQAPAPGQGRGQAPPTAKAQAPVDLTGWWVSVVTEDWRWRMVTPAKGDYSSLPLNAEGRRVADGWDPTKDQREGNACRSYGAAALMRVPGRLHVTWLDDNTLKIEADAGTQSRLLHFGNLPAPPGPPGWQGYSSATWEIAGAGRGGGRAAAPQSGPTYGSLKVVTTKLKAGYLRKNGVPYSENAVVTEFFDRHNEPNGDQWFTVTTTVDDPAFLQQPFITSSGFKREADGAKWRPTPCSAQ